MVRRMTKIDREIVSDSVNRGTSTARRMQASLYDWIVYQRRSKAREREGEEEQRRSIFYMAPWSRDCYCPRLSETVCDCPPQSTVFHQCRNITPPSQKACP